MAYDSNVTSSVLNLDLKRRIWRVDFQRPPVTGEGSIYANCYLKEDAIDATVDSDTSGSVISSVNWMITIDKNQILGISGSNYFMTGLVELVSGLKDEYDATGSLATGSISPIP